MADKSGEDEMMGRIEEGVRKMGEASRRQRVMLAGMLADFDGALERMASMGESIARSMRMSGEMSSEAEREGVERDADTERSIAESVASADALRDRLCKAIDEMKSL